MKLYPFAIIPLLLLATVRSQAADICDQVLQTNQWKGALSIPGDDGPYAFINMGKAYRGENTPVHLSIGCKRPNDTFSCRWSNNGFSPASCTPIGDTQASVAFAGNANGFNIKVNGVATLQQEGLSMLLDFENLPLFPGKPGMTASNKKFVPR